MSCLIDITARVIVLYSILQANASFIDPLLAVRSFLLADPLGEHVQCHFRTLNETLPASRLVTPHS